MSAKIISVDYEAIPGQARQIRTKGQELNKEISTAYQSVMNMHENWYGKRYNALVKSFNDIVNEVNSMLTLVVKEIPFALETVANNYSKADRGQNACAATATEPVKVTILPMPADVGMKFLSAPVETTKNNVSNNFNKAKSMMEEIRSMYLRINWQSEASEAFKGRFEKLKAQILEAFNNIESQFSTLMRQALDEVQRAETSNTVQ